MWEMFSTILIISHASVTGNIFSLVGLAKRFCQRLAQVPANVVIDRNPCFHVFENEKSTTLGVSTGKLDDDQIFKLIFRTLTVWFAFPFVRFARQNILHPQSVYATFNEGHDSPGVRGRS